MRAPHIVRIPLPNGGYLVCGPGEDYHLGGYLALDDDQEREILRWTADEWNTPGEGESVIGAVFGYAALPLDELRARAAGWGPDKTGTNPPDACNYRLYARVTEDASGGWSAVVLNLPGVGSCGVSLDEAADRALEAVAAALAQYRADGVPVPWRALTPADFAAGPVETWSIANPEV